MSVELARGWVLGEQVDNWKAGDKVLFHGNMFSQHGGLAEFCLQDNRTLTLLPNFPIAMAASTPCAGWTAWRALFDKLKIKNRNSIFIAGGSGGVCSFAIQIAKHFGLETIITTCSGRNIDYVRSLGATHIIDYQAQDVVKEIMAITQFANRVGRWSSYEYHPLAYSFCSASNMCCGTLNGDPSG